METEQLLECIANNELKLEAIVDKVSICAFRKSLYSVLHKNIAPKHAKLVRHLLSIEMKERCKDAYDDEEVFEDTYDFEAFYWCIFLLFKIGAVEDVKTIWQAKHIDFDASFGVDMQFLVGAGVDKTVAFLKQQPDATSLEILNYILECQSEGLFDDIQGWYDFRCNYYLQMIE